MGNFVVGLMLAPAIRTMGMAFARLPMHVILSMRLSMILIPIVFRSVAKSVREKEKGCLKS